MKLSSWLEGWWAKAIGALGVYGTLAGLGLLPLPAALVALLVGALTNNVILALGIALATSLTANVILATAFWRSPWRRRRSTVRTPRPKAFATEDDLGSLILTSTDLEEWWANAMTAARIKVGPDARGFVESIHISQSTFMVIYGESVAAGKGFNLHVAGPHPDHVSWLSVHRKEKVWQRTLSEPLWRSDDSWRELVRQSWIRERPLNSGSALYPRESSHGRYWELHYAQYLTDDERLIPGRMYRLREGQLEVRQA